MTDTQRDPALPVSLLVVDDNPEVGASLGRWFMLCEDVRWAGWLPGPDGIDAAIAQTTPRVVLVDWDLHGMDTAALLARLVEGHPHVTFAVLSGNLGADSIRAALRAGASGYLSKDNSPAELAAEIKRLAAGRIVLSEEAQQAIKVEEAERI
jgi:DNA-binding NarL/FixJ family response regulator